MTIVIPMAGLSSRFTKAGYILPKYMLYAGGKSLFAHAVDSFRKYFNSTKFVFVARNVFDTKRFIEEECSLLGIIDYCIVMLESPTRGQAETVVKGIEGAKIPNNESILIFNIDTFRPGFSIPKRLSNCDGWLECFYGDGTNWSYAKTDDDQPYGRVIETAEKREISHYCSTGIYQFARCSDFLKAYSINNGIDPKSPLRECYVAPLYNNLIKEGLDIRVSLIKRNDVIFCGIPQEYTDFLKQCIH